MLEIILFILGALFILASLFLTYKQNKDLNSDFDSNSANDYIHLNRELKERENRLAELLDSLNNGLDNKLDNLEAKQKNLNNSSLKGTYNNPRKFSKVLGSRLELSEDSEVNIEKVNNSKLNNDLENKEELQESEISSSDLKKSKYQQIAEFSAAGLSFAQIAKKLDLGQREVELILKFNDRGDN